MPQLNRVAPQVQAVEPEIGMDQENSKLSKFSGNFAEEDTATTWLEDFEDYRKAVGLPEQRDAATLPLHLKGSAKEFFRGLTNDVKSDYTALRTALIDEFETAQHRQHSADCLHKRIQKDNEPARDFANTLNILCRGAFGGNIAAAAKEPF